MFDVLSSCCKVRLPWIFDCYGAGQVFDSDGYNVIVTAQVSTLCWVEFLIGVVNGTLGLLMDMDCWR